MGTTGPTMGEWRFGEKGTWQAYIILRGAIVALAATGLLVSSTLRVGPVAARGSLDSYLPGLLVNLGGGLAYGLLEIANQPQPQCRARRRSLRILLHGPVFASGAIAAWVVICLGLGIGDDVVPVVSDGWPLVVLALVALIVGACTIMVSWRRLPILQEVGSMNERR